VLPEARAEQIVAGERGISCFSTSSSSEGCVPSPAPPELRRYAASPLVVDT
jgi:hypothetical protein